MVVLLLLELEFVVVVKNAVKPSDDPVLGSDDSCFCVLVVVGAVARGLGTAPPAEASRLGL